MTSILLVETDRLETIAGSIRAKTKKSDGMTVSQMSDEILSISTFDYMKPLCFTANSGSTIYIKTPTSLNINLEMSYDSKEWVEWNKDDSGVFETITLNNGENLYVRGENNVMASSSSEYSQFIMTGSVEVSGHLTSLLTRNSILMSLEGRNYCFYGLFQNCDAIKHIEKLKLLPIILSDYCYYGMFQNCTSITTSPELPATTLASYCYGQMFYGCSSLTTAPELPATTLANNCYSSMFQNCTSLTTGPELPATTLANNCYSSMFQNCTSLTTGPELPATNLANYCYSYMFQNCTSLTTGPELPATKLRYNCYYFMFQGCKSLTSVPELPATNLATYCYFCMFQFCTSLTTAPKLPATTLANYCYRYMFQGCTSLTTAPELPATTLAQYCYDSMFYNCTSLTTAPELPATTLAKYCYNSMFYNCKKLNFIKVGATSWDSSCTQNWVKGVASTGTFVKPEDTSIPTGESGIPENWVFEFKALKFTANADNSTIALQGGLSTITLEYSYNGYSWNEWVKDDDNLFETIALNTGETVYFRGDNERISTAESQSRFVMTGSFDAANSVMYLLSKDGNIKSLEDRPYCFCQLFSDCVSLVTAPELPATTLGESCYDSMFSGCTSLTTAPRLSSEILGDYCYYGMFYGCTSLTTAPELPATTLTISCYSSMFYNCASLTTAPELPAMSMEDGCYSSMFQGCTSLTTAPELPATTLEHMCYANMFEGCVLLTTAPELPAKTLIIHCYSGMFRNCSKLSYIKVGATYWPTSSGEICSQGWVDGVASTGTFFKPGGVEMAENVNSIPIGWDVVTDTPVEVGKITVTYKGTLVIEDSFNVLEVATTADYNNLWNDPDMFSTLKYYATDVEFKSTTCGMFDVEHLDCNGMDYYSGGFRNKTNPQKMCVVKIAIGYGDMYDYDSTSWDDRYVLVNVVDGETTPSNWLVLFKQNTAPIGGQEFKVIEYHPWM